MAKIDISIDCTPPHLTYTVEGDGRRFVFDNSEMRSLDVMLSIIEDLVLAQCKERVIRTSDNHIKRTARLYKKTVNRHSTSKAAYMRRWRYRTQKAQDGTK